MAALAICLLTLSSTLSLAPANQESKAKPLVFANVTVIDASGGRTIPNATVVIRGDRIAAVGDVSKVRFPKDAQVVDASGKFLIPGLWDMHTHLSFYADTKQPPFTVFPALVANGITGVRDMGGNLDQIDKWRAEIAAGAFLGPRIFRAGPYVDGPKKMNEFRAALTVVVKDAKEARAAVTDLKLRGVDFIKVHNGVSREAFLALAAECRKQGVPLATHLPRSLRIAEASEAGTNSLEHIEMLIESIAYDVAPGASPKDPVDALDEFNDEKAMALFARFVKNKTWYTPTLIGYRTFVQEAEDGMAKEPAKWKDTFEARHKLFARLLQLLGMMRKAGVGLLAATDFARKAEAYAYPVPQPGADLHRELALMVEAGLTPLEALQTATLNPAIYLGIRRDYGTVEKGKKADVVLLDANPLKDIANTRRIHAVVINGRYLSSEMLQKTVDNSRR